MWRTDIIVAATTLTGHDDNPGELLGWGPITARTARHLTGVNPDDLNPGAGSDHHTSGDPWPPQDTGPPPALSKMRSVWRRLLTDPHTGTVTDYGTTRYRPPQHLADLIRARDGRCIQPGCRTPAWRTDIDHIRNSPAGPSPRPHPEGATADFNLGSACRTDHTIKTMPGWNLATPAPGVFLWTTPTGHTYRRDNEPPLGGHTYLPQLPSDDELAGNDHHAPDEYLDNGHHDYDGPPPPF